MTKIGKMMLMTIDVLTIFGKMKSNDMGSSNDVISAPAVSVPARTPATAPPRVKSALPVLESLW